MRAYIFLIIVECETNKLSHVTNGVHASCVLGAYRGLSESADPQIWDLSESADLGLMLIG